MARELQALRIASVDQATTRDREKKEVRVALIRDKRDQPDLTLAFSRVLVCINGCNYL